MYLPESPIRLQVNSVDDIGSVSQAYFDSFVLGNEAKVFGNWLTKVPHSFH